MSMKIKDVINRISYFRVQQNISARELSVRLGNDKSYITRMESEEFNLTVKKLLEILNEFNINPEQFFAENYASYNEDAKLQQDFIQLSDEDKKIVELLVKRLKNKK